MRTFNFKIYPRPDVVYQAKKSIDFQTVKSNIYQRYFPRGKKVGLYAWLVFGIVGIAMGFIAFFVDLFVEHLMIWKWEVT